MKGSGSVQKLGIRIHQNYGFGSNYESGTSESTKTLYQRCNRTKLHAPGPLEIVSYQRNLYISFQRSQKTEDIKDFLHFLEGSGRSQNIADPEHW
jgi:hypothetical protein